MHEMGIAMQIVEIATASIPGDMANASVARVNLKVGKLAAVVPESLRFCFEIVSKDTPLSGAQLVIEEIPVRARCNQCHKEWEITTPAFICTSCRSTAIELLSGRELDIHSIEIIDEDPQNAVQS